MTRGSGWVAEKFDRRAASYDESASHRWQAEQAVEFLAPSVGETVLDVATGTGLAARAVAERVGPAGAVVGVDVSAGMLRQACRVAGGRRCWFVRADAAAVPLRAGVFDAVVCVAGVSYFPDPVAALREWRRVARARARVVVTVPALGGITTWRVLRQAAASEGVGLADPAGPLADPERRARLAAASGWSVEQVSEVAFEEPLSEPAAAFGFIDSGFAEQLRTASAEIRQRVWVRFEALYRAEAVEVHRVLLVRMRRPSTLLTEL